MSEGIQKVLTMSGGKSAWRKMTGGIDLDGLSGGQLFVREASEELIFSEDLGSVEPEVQGDGELLAYTFRGYSGPALAEGTRYRIKIFEQTWDVVAEKVPFPNGDNPVELAVIGNPGLDPRYGLQDNGLPFFFTTLGSILLLEVRAAEFASVTAGEDPASQTFVVWEVHDKELVSLPVVMLFTEDGTTLTDAEGNQITDFTEIVDWFAQGRTVMLKRNTSSAAAVYSPLAIASYSSITFGSGLKFSIN